jgi:hypothetical protein
LGCRKTVYQSDDELRDYLICQVGTPVTPREPHAPKKTGNHTILGYDLGVPIHMWLDTEPIRDIIG